MDSLIEFDACEECYYGLTREGKVVGWGHKGIIPEPLGTYVPMPTDMGAVKHILCTAENVFAIDSSDTVRVWGQRTGLFLGLPAGLKALSLSTTNGRSVAAILLDNTVVAWGDSIAAIPDGLLASEIKIYDGYGMAVNLQAKVIMWGALPAGFVIPAALDRAKSIASAQSTAIALQESRYIMSWKGTDYRPVPVFPHELNNTAVTSIDSFDNSFYGAVSKKKLYFWRLTNDVGIVIADTSAKVATFRIRNYEGSGKFTVCVLHTTGLVSIMGGLPKNRKVPASIAQKAGQSSLTTLLIDPLAPAIVPDAAVLPVPVAQGPVPAAQGPAPAAQGPVPAAQGPQMVNPLPPVMPLFVKSLCLGEGHAAALTESGKVICWGSFCPREVQELDDVRAISCGSRSLHVLKKNNLTYWNDDGSKETITEDINVIYNDVDDNSMYCTANDYRFIGYNPPTIRGIGKQHGFSQIVKRPLYTLALTNFGVVKLYASEDDESLVPIPKDIENKKFTAISGGLQTALAIDKDDNLYGWSTELFQHPVLPPGKTKAKFIASSGSRNAIIDYNNLLTIWSYRPDGSIEIYDLPPWATNAKVKFVSLTDTSFGVITTGGKVLLYSEGGALSGIPASIIATNNDCTQYLPVMPDACSVKQLATGKGFTIGLLKNSSIIGWGDDSQGQLSIPAISAKFICAGDGIAGAIKEDDTFVSWGRALDSLGDVKVNKVILQKSGLALTMAGDVIAFGPGSRAVPAGLKAYDIAFLEYDNKYRCAAIKTDNSVVVWGDDVTPVTLPAGDYALGIAVGRTAVLVINKKLKVLGFGSNSHSELDIPSQLTTGDIFAGDSCLAIQKDSGLLGNWGVKMDALSTYGPTWVKRSTAFGQRSKKIVYAVYNGNHFAAVNEDGLVLLWGTNSFKECVLPNQLLPIIKPINMGVITGLSLQQSIGAVIVDDKVKVWGGLLLSPSDRAANISPAGQTLQICNGGPTWFSLSQDQGVECWNVEFGLARGLAKPLLDSIGRNFDKISVSINILLGIKDGAVAGYCKRGFGIKEIPTSMKRGAKAIFAGPTCAMGIDRDNRLIIWGSKFDACLLPPADLGSVKKVICTEFFAVAIKLDGTLRVWGGLSAGALAALVSLLPGGSFKDITCYNDHYLGIRDDDTVVEWGQPHYINDYVMPPLLKASQISTSGSMGCSAAIDLQGELVLWGTDSKPLEELIISAVAIAAAPAAPAAKVYGALPNDSVQTVFKSTTKAMAVASGGNNIGIINEQGSIVVWGGAASKRHFIPRFVTGVQQLFMGLTCCIAQNSLGQYIYWGYTEVGSSLNELPDTLDAKKIVLTDNVGLAINEDNTLLKWGKIPGMKPSADFSALPTDISKKVRDVDAYLNNYIACGLDGKIFVWGAEAVISDKYKDSKALSVSIGRRHCVAILEDNTVVSWGLSNEYKQQNVPKGLKAKSIKCGHHFTVAIDMSDNVVAWGFPKACSLVPAGQKAASIAVGAKHVVALQEDGIYVIWAHNVYGVAKKAPETVFIDPDITLVNQLPTDFSRDFYIPTKYTLNVKQMKTVKRVDKVFDLGRHGDRNLVDFLLEHQGNAVVFSYKGVLSGTLKSVLEKGFKDINPTAEDSSHYTRINVFYECVRQITVDDAGYGTFEYKDIYKQPYYQITLSNGSCLITIEDLARIFKQNQFWLVQETGIKLANTASYLSVLAGGPIISANHCQAGTEKEVSMLVPLSFKSEEVEETVEVPKDRVSLRIGEEKLDIDITEGRTVGDVKAKLALIKGVAADSMRFIAGGKILKNEEEVVPGLAIMVMMPRGGRRTLKTGTREKRRQSLRR